MPLFTLPVISLVVSTVANVVGIEGGAIVVPLLVFLYGLTPASAASTVIPVMIVGLGLGAIQFWRQRRIDIPLALYLMSASIPGGILGSALTDVVSASLLKMVVSFVLLLASIRFLFLAHLKVPATIGHGTMHHLVDRRGQQFDFEVYHQKWAWPILFFAGLIQGMSGTGVGIIQMPILLLVLGVPPHIAVATSVFSISFLSMATTLGHMFFGYVPWLYVGWLLPGVFIGSRLGPHLSQKLHPEQLQKVLGYVLLVIAAGMLYITFV